MGRTAVLELEHTGGGGGVCRVFDANKGVAKNRHTALCPVVRGVLLRCHTSVKVELVQPASVHHGPCQSVASVVEASRHPHTPVSGAPSLAVVVGWLPSECHINASARESADGGCCPSQLTCFRHASLAACGERRPTRPFEGSSHGGAV